jgi:hypothetical protein
MLSFVVTVHTLAAGRVALRASGALRYRFRLLIPDRWASRSTGRWLTQINESEKIEAEELSTLWRAKACRCPWLPMIVLLCDVQRRR